MEHNNKKFMAPVIIGVSDLAFVLLFCFIVLGTGAQRMTVIDLPFGGRATVQDLKTKFTVEIKRSSNTSLSEMIVRYNGIPTESIRFTVSTENLSKQSAYQDLKMKLDAIFGKFASEDPKNRTVEIYSSVYSYYGLIAVTIAACNQLDYKVSLRYKSSEG
jgi:biopolymer transport protein ExbD